MTEQMPDEEVIEAEPVEQVVVQLTIPKPDGTTVNATARFDIPNEMPYISEMARRAAESLERTLILHLVEPNAFI